jgi:hypothetical protein
MLDIIHILSKVLGGKAKTGIWCVRRLFIANSNYLADQLEPPGVSIESTPMDPRTAGIRSYI